MTLHVIVRATHSHDIYLVDGQELPRCGAGMGGFLLYALVV